MGSKRHVDFLGDGQSVHVGSKGHHRSGFPAAEHPDNAGMGLSFVIINRRGNCGLVCSDEEEESKVDVRETVPPSRRLRT